MLKKPLNMTVELIPVGMDALGTPSNSKERWEKIGIETEIIDHQKTAVIYTARILRKVLVSGMTSDTLAQEQNFHWQLQHTTSI